MEQRYCAQTPVLKILLIFILVGLVKYMKLKSASMRELTFMLCIPATPIAEMETDGKKWRKMGRNGDKWKEMQISEKK